MDMWPEAVTGRLAEPLHLTNAQPQAQQQQKKQITLPAAAGNPFASQYDTRLLVVLNIQNVTRGSLCVLFCLKSKNCNQVHQPRSRILIKDYEYGDNCNELHVSLKRIPRHNTNLLISIFSPLLKVYSLVIDFHK